MHERKNEWMKTKRGERAKRRMDSVKSLPWPASTAATTTSRPNKAASIVVKSVTRDEIDRFWRLKQMQEEEHLLAALKAAARIRARTLSEEDYRRFEESLRDVMKRANDTESNKQVGINNWWTKSKYAYLNQAPATKSMGEPTTYKACSYSPASSNSLPASLGVF